MWYCVVLSGTSNTFTSYRPQELQSKCRVIFMGLPRYPFSNRTHDVPADETDDERGSG